MEALCKDLDKFAEIDTALGNVVEDGLDLIALILHVTNLHVKTHVGSNLARLDHRVVLQRNGLLPTLNVVRFCLAVDLFVLAIEGGESRATNLLGYHVARKRDDANVVAGRCLYGNDITTFEIKIVNVLIV